MAELYMCRRQATRQARRGSRTVTASMPRFARPCRCTAPPPQRSLAVTDCLCESGTGLQHQAGLYASVASLSPGFALTKTLAFESRYYLTFDLSMAFYKFSGSPVGLVLMLAGGGVGGKRSPSGWVGVGVCVTEPRWRC